MNPTPWPAPPAPGEQRLRSTTASPMQSPTLSNSAGTGTLQAALQQQPLSSPPPPVAAAAAAAVAPSAVLSASSQQTLLRGSSSSSVAAGANNGSSAEVTSPDRDKGPQQQHQQQRRFLGGVVGLPRERAHHLRVRKRVPLAPGLAAELGVGTELLSGEVTRHAALTYDVSEVTWTRERE